MKIYTHIFAILILCYLEPQALGIEVNIEDLKKGGIVTEDLVGEKGGGLKATFWVQASPETVYKILSDGGKFSEFMPNMVVSRVINSGENFQDVYYKLHFWFSDVEYVLHRVLEKDKMKITWNLLKGRFKRMDGYWEIADGGEGSVVTYYTYLELRIYVPKTIVTYLTKGSLPELVDAVRRRAESGGRWKKI